MSALSHEFTSSFLVIRPGNGSPSASNVPLIVSIYIVMLISQPIVVKLPIHIGDNNIVIHNHTVSDFQLKS